MAAGHLVAHREVALGGHVDLDHLEHAGRQLVAAREPVDDLVLLDLLVVDARLEVGHGLLGLARLVLGRAVLGGREAQEAHAAQLVVGGRVVERDRLAGQVVGHVLAQRGLDVAQHRHAVLAQRAQELLLGVADDVERLGALGVGQVDAPRELLRVDHHAARARRHRQRGVLHVHAGLAEDRVQELLLGRELALRLGRHLADQDVAGLDEVADPHDARVVQVGERLLAHVGDVARELLLAQLGLADLDLVLLDVDRGEGVVVHQALADQDRVLVVEAVPGQEGHHQVLAQRQLAVLGRGAVGQQLPGLDQVAFGDDRAVVLGGALVELLELDQRVLGLVDLDHLRVDEAHRAVLLGEDREVGVARDDALHAGAHHRRFRAQERHGLALHVRAHQRAVGVVVLEERDQRGGDADDLVRRDVDEVHVRGRALDVVAVAARQHALADEVALLVDHQVGRRHDLAGLLVRAQVDDLVRELAVPDAPVGRGQEAVLVDLGEERQRTDQADVGAFGRLDRAQPAVVREVHVAHVEAGALAVQPARSEGREAPLVGQLAERVRLVDDLAELAAAEEVLDRAGEGLGVDQVARRDRLRVLEVHALLGRASQLEQTLAELVRGELGDRAHAPVAQVVDVVDLALVGPQVEQVLDRVDDVVRLEHLHVERGLLRELAVQAETAHATQAVALGIEELLVEQLARLLALDRVARAQAAVDLEQRLLVALGRVLVQRVDDQHVELLHVGFDQLDLAQVAGRDLERGRLGDRHARGHEHLARLERHHVPHRDAVGDQLGEGALGLVARLLDHLGGVEHAQDVAVGRERLGERAQERDGRELARLVDPNRERVLLGHVQLYPRAALGDDPGRVQLAVVAGAGLLVGEVSEPLMMNSPPPIMIGISPR